MVPLVEALVAQHPELEDADEAIREGRVLLDGRPILNPRARVAESARMRLAPEVVLRGSAKLAAAIDRFEIAVEGRTALDAGAAAGGFTSVLLARGAARVYAVDAGHGQLRGELLQNPSVVNLERTNLGELTTELVPDPIDVVTLDLSYLSLSRAIPELERVRLAADVDLVALVKPMFELSLATPPTDPGAARSCRRHRSARCRERRMARDRRDGIAGPRRSRCRGVPAPRPAIAFGRWIRPPLPSTSSRSNVDGYTIVEGAVDAALVDDLTAELARLEHDLEVMPAANSFEGAKTLRVYNLLAHGDVWRHVPVHESVLPVVEGVLDPGLPDFVAVIREHRPGRELPSPSTPTTC